MKKNRATLILLILIVVIAGILRSYKLGSTPPGLFVDEAAVGYNAYSIANFGKDEWGNTFPLVFKSFGENKMPVHIYFTAISTKLLGLSEFSTRLPSAVFGILCVILLFFVAKLLFSNSLVALFSASLLAISPYHLQFSRVAWETNFALFFFLSGLILFFSSLKRSFLRPLSLLAFILSFLSYNAAKVFVPLFVLVLTLVYLKEVKATKWWGLTSMALLAIFVVTLILVPDLTGYSRFDSVRILPSSVESTVSFSLTHTAVLGELEIVVRQYFSHFTVKYLFTTGEENIRHSIGTIGEFYPIEAAFLIIGFLNLLIKRTQKGLILAAWAFLAPLPASLADPAPHASRAMFMLGSWTLVSAWGMFLLVAHFKSLKRVAIIIGLLFFLAWGFEKYLQSYYNDYPINSAKDWQYGMKEVVNFTSSHPEYKNIYTDAYDKPYIYFLFYQRVPVDTFLSNSKRNQDGWVSSFGKYTFDNWGNLQTFAKPGSLYIIDSTKMQDLQKKHKLDIKKQIDLPNGDNALNIIQVI